VFLEGARWPWSHTSLTIRPGRTGGMGGAGAYPCTARGSSVIRMRQGTVPRGQAPKGRGFGTGFSHTVEFSRNVAGLLFGDSPAVPASRRRRSGGTVPRAFQGRQRPPTCPVSVLLVEHHPPRRHLHTEAPPCAPEPSGRQDGHRTAVGLTPSGARRPPVFRCRRRGRRPGEVLGLEELPCLQLGDGSTAFDTVSTCRCCWTPATTTVPGGWGCQPAQRPPGDRYSPAGFRTGGSPR
jgi:hypothetical protein